MAAQTTDPKKDLKHFLPDKRLVPDAPSSEHKLISKPAADANKIIGQVKQLVYGNLYFVQDIELVSVEWVKQFSIENESDATRTKTDRTETGVQIQTGKEDAESISATAGYSGFGFEVSIEGSYEHKTFSSVETSEITTTEDTWTVPPQTTLYVYKKVYNLRGTIWVAGITDEIKVFASKDGRTRCEGSYDISITSTDELDTYSELEGEGTLEVTRPDDFLAQPADWLPANVVEMVLETVLNRSFPWLA
ncbi:hypothetical protein BP00DRAFT_443131 [Aspergillus indologenus CBS 114.80]|uniref:Uncharacterized protein n=1 Tax=Aspergillus indologenus CBS 114.80 TaxID=1450541 RepID=A0A2V5IIA3_9EURO|nr:hypothetical protein BP00DRAFT_443131 [Aspergillus indologenus CBS 114.80]